MRPAIPSRAQEARLRINAEAARRIEASAARSPPHIERCYEEAAAAVAPGWEVELVWAQGAVEPLVVIGRFRRE